MAKKLTLQNDAPFELGFKYPLEKGYTFKELSQRNNKEFQIFLDKISRMTVQQVDELYAKKPDCNDRFKNMQVYHYGVTNTFRIHVVLEAGHYKIIRLDPNHKVHS